MKAFLLLSALTFSAISRAQCLDEIAYREDLRKSLRSQFETPFNRRVEERRDLSKVKLPREGAVIFFEQLSEDKIFPQGGPTKKNPCPAQLIRLYHVLDVDEFRKCNGLVRSDAMDFSHIVLYRQCTLN